MQGRVDKIAKEMSLMDQQFIKDTNKTVAVSRASGPHARLGRLLLRITRGARALAAQRT